MKLISNSAIIFCKDDFAQLDLKLEFNLNISFYVVLCCDGNGNKVTRLN